MDAVVPAPWRLSGTALIALFRVPPAEREARGFVPAPMQARFRGGLAALMAVDYEHSEAGPYQELLFIPGKFDFAGRSLYSITRILVSTEASRAGGRANWGIPKELGEFDLSRGGGEVRFEVRAGGASVLGLTAREGRLGFPLHSGLYPFPLAHELDGKRFYTRPTASGRVRLARLEARGGDGTLFPRLEGLSPLVAVSVERFQMVFNPARIEPGSPTS